MNNTIRTIILWLVIPVALVFIVVYLKTGGAVQPVTFSDVLEYGRHEMIKSVKITPDKIEGELKEPKLSGERKFNRFSTPVIFYDDLIPMMKDWDVEISLSPGSTETFMPIVWIITFTAFIVFLVYFLRQMQAGGNKAMMFGKSKAKLLNASQKKVTFVDVAGCEEAKEELEEIIDFLREPQKFQRLGGKIPKGVLLMGPPGTGKTLLAKATAGEASVPFFSISGSDFVEMFVGVGASRVRDLFEQGKKNAPCIIFIDEIDAVGRHRGGGMGGGHDEREQTLNQLLVEMDGFESNDGVILVAGTNRPDVLDPALLRPGRFDRRVVVDLPDVKGRAAILKVHSSKVPLAPDVELDNIARGASGFSGADLANMVNEAALLAARKGKKMVFRIDFEDAKDKILMGAERRSMLISDKEKWTTAIHESGHAVVAGLVGDADPVHKVTIIPRGRALGVTQQLPMDDRHSYNVDYLRNRLAILMGGRVAEELFFDQMTSGASNDIEVASGLARRMVCELGMSVNVGPISFKAGGDQPYMGREFSRQQPTSEKTAELIDAEVKDLIMNADKRARQLISEYRDIVQAMADKLMEVETLNDWQVAQLLAREEVTPKNPCLDAPTVTPPDTDSTPSRFGRGEKIPGKGLSGVLPKPPLAQT